MECLKHNFEGYQFASEPVYQCPLCQDTGIVDVICKNGNIGARKCECAIRKQFEIICSKTGFPLAEAKTLDDYQVWNGMTRIAKAKAEEYIQNFDNIRQQNKNWFIVFGLSGSGKTMLGRAIVRALIERKKPVRARAVKYYDMMQKLKAKSNYTDYGELLDHYIDCELLFIDDLLKEKAQSGDMTEADIKHLFAVIDSRYDTVQPTVITTECTCSRLCDLNEAIYWRIQERAFAKIIFVGTENNYRKRQSSEGGGGGV